MSYTFRIWIDDGKHNEAEDGEDVVQESHLASDAVRTFAETRYSALQHVDPGRVLVRYPNGGSVVSWEMQVRVLLEVCAMAVVEDNGDGA